MLTEEQIKEIREHLENSQNPLFFFDNDADGLCSFLLLARYLGRGKGVAIKSFPDLNESYARKLYELKPDSVFVLDKPVISEGFLQEAKNLNLPVIWIDHHGLGREAGKKEEVYYYDPTLSDEKKTEEPVTYWCWKISERKQDLWLAVCGCIGDNFFPDFIGEFARQYPDLWRFEITGAFPALYETEIGKITRVMGFALKDRTSNVVRMQKILMQIKSPAEILEETPRNHMLFRFRQVDKKYQKLIEKARKFARKNLVYFQYGGELSLSADIANELTYRFPGKIIVVAYLKGTKANISLRGKNVKKITLKAIENLEGATGGGHEDATGAKINVEDLPKFRERIEGLVN